MSAPRTKRKNKMNFFCMPSDFKNETIDEYEKLNTAYKDARIIETYGNITIGNFMESGRATSQLPRVSLSDLQGFIKYSNEKGIDFNYTINATHMQNREFSEKGILEIKRFLGEIYEAGVRALTIALPSLMELVQSTKYGFRIRGSTLCQVTNATKALAFKNMGLDRLVPDESLNKDFKALKRIIRAFGEKVEIIVNPICYKNCIYRMFHYNQIGSDSVGITGEISTNYYEHRCVLQRHERISNLLRLCWVRPEDLKYYNAVGIQYFKLQGRQLVFSKDCDVVRTVKAYMDQSYDGDFWDLITMGVPVNNFKIAMDNKRLDGFIKPFYEEKLVCQNDCDQCGYCDRFARKCIDFNKAEEIARLSEEFYNGYDQFKKALAKVDNKKITIVKNTQSDDAGGFDF